MDAGWRLELQSEAYEASILPLEEPAIFNLYIYYIIDFLKSQDTSKLYRLSVYSYEICCMCLMAEAEGFEPSVHY